MAKKTEQGLLVRWAQPTRGFQFQGPRAGYGPEALVGGLGRFVVDVSRDPGGDDRYRQVR